MAIGPVQLLLLGFSHPEFPGQIRGELDRQAAFGALRAGWTDVLPSVGQSQWGSR